MAKHGWKGIRWYLGRAPGAEILFAMVDNDPDALIPVSDLVAAPRQTGMRVPSHVFNTLTHTHVQLLHSGIVERC